jgi:hypothetical protein
MENDGVLRHPNVPFSEARPQMEAICIKTAATPAELENHLSFFSQSSDWDLVLIDAIYAPCLDGLHSPKNGIFTILTSGDLLRRFAVARDQLADLLQDARCPIAVVCDYGNDLNCFSAFQVFLGQVNVLRAIYPNFLFVVVDNQSCGGLMQHAVAIKKGEVVVAA